MAGTWSVDSTTLTGLRQREAQRALTEGRLDDALIEAEELLDDDPSNQHGLAIAGIAALRMGDVVMALEALNRFVELHTPSATILHSLAVARFEAVDYPGCLVAAEQATAKEPGLVAAWHYQGLALERMENPEKARERFERACALDPDQFPVPEQDPTIDWDALLESATKRLPDRIRDFVVDVPIAFAPCPAVADLLENYPPLSPFTDALYRGTPPSNGADPWTSRPTRITLFTANLTRPSSESEDLVTRIEEALVHEAMHWLGMTKLPA